MKLWVPIFFVILIFSGCPEVQEKQEFLNSEATPKIVEKEGMVLIPATKYVRGNDKTPGNGEKYPEEGPAHEVEVHGFWIDKYEVTNAEFKKFIDETGYVTFAEKPLDKNLFPNAPENQLEPGATIFSPPPDSINPWDENSHCTFPRHYPPYHRVQSHLVEMSQLEMCNGIRLEQNF